MYPKEFYLVPEEIFRLGNANTPKLSHVRPIDVDTLQINGITVIADCIKWKRCKRI
jgi:hypothetical protein